MVAAVSPAEDSLFSENARLAEELAIATREIEEVRANRLLVLNDVTRLHQQCTMMLEALRKAYDGIYGPRALDLSQWDALKKSMRAAIDAATN